MQLSPGDPRVPLVEYTVKLSECHHLPQSHTLIIFLCQEHCYFRATETIPTPSCIVGRGQPTGISLISALFKQILATLMGEPA